MNDDAIEVDIDRLLVHGPLTAGRADVAAAVRAAIQARIAEHGVEALERGGPIQLDGRRP